MQKGFTLWLTGLSGAGKTTIAHILEKKMKQMRFKVELLDGDAIRSNLSPDLGFSKQDRMVNIKRVAFIAKLLTRNNVIVIASLISPYNDIRSYCRAEIDDYIEVFVKCPLDVLIKRDTKGLYEKALAGEIANFTGISDPYEEPLNPEITVATDRETPEQSAEKILQWLKQKNYIR